MSRRFFLWIVLLVLITGTYETFAQGQGLMLGLRYTEPIAKPLPYYQPGPDSLARPVYRTLLIAETGGVPSIVGEVSNLLIPRANRFWQVGTKRSVYNNWIEDFVWAMQDDDVPEWSGIQAYNGEYCEGHRTHDILYAGPSYLSFQQRSAGYCEGAAHPWFFNTLAVVPIDSTEHPGLDINAVLGEAALKALNVAAETVLSSLDAENADAQFIEGLDPANWGLVRREGRWNVIGRVETFDTVKDDTVIDIPLNLDISAALLGRRERVVPWRKVLQRAPDAVDAFNAPDNSWIVILHPQRLTIHTIVNGEIGRAVLSRGVPAGARAVTVRWTTGARLTSWIQRFEKVARLQQVTQ